MGTKIERRGWGNVRRRKFSKEKGREEARVGETSV
jgi:hypothetical protein